MKGFKKWVVSRYFGLRKRLGDRRKWQLSRSYYLIRGRMPDFDNPSDLSEYIMSNILYEKNHKYSKLVDKLLVKEYVKSKGLDAIVPKSLGVWDNSSQIDYDVLPERFALKINHGCGYNLFYRDKSTFDRKQAGDLLNGWLHQTYSTLETHYSQIEPKIFAEEFIDDQSGLYPVDYRIYCFAGKPVLIDTTVRPDSGLTTELKHYIMDTDWNYMPQYASIIYDDWRELPKSENLGKMIEYAAILSQDFEFVRVDMYDIGSKVFFGEFTFSPSIGVFAQFNDLALREMYKMLAS